MHTKVQTMHSCGEQAYDYINTLNQCYTTSVIQETCF